MAPVLVLFPGRSWSSSWLWDRKRLLLFPSRPPPWSHLYGAPVHQLLEVVDADYFLQNIKNPVHHAKEVVQLRLGNDGGYGSIKVCYVEEARVDDIVIELHPPERKTSSLIQAVWLMEVPEGVYQTSHQEALTIAEGTGYRDQRSQG